MAFRGFTRRAQRNGAWYSRLAVGESGITPVYPPLHILPGPAPSGDAEAGDIYVDTNGQLQVSNGTNFAPAGGLVTLSHLFDAATAVDRNVFVADRAYQLVSVEAAHATASTSGTLDIEKCTGTTAPGSGTSMLTGTLDLAGAANTVVSGTLHATAANTVLADGDRIAYDFGGTVTNLVGAAVTIVLRPI
jgi:hypothetical protein